MKVIISAKMEKEKERRRTEIWVRGTRKCLNHNFDEDGTEESRLTKVQAWKTKEKTNKHVCHNFDGAGKGQGEDPDGDLGKKGKMSKTSTKKEN